MAIQKNANAHGKKKSTLEMAWIVTILMVVGNGGYSPILGSYGKRIIRLNFVFLRPLSWI